jgi:hypothetical protein
MLHELNCAECDKNVLILAQSETTRPWADTVEISAFYRSHRRLISTPDMVDDGWKARASVLSGARSRCVKLPFQPSIGEINRELNPRSVTQSHSPSSKILEMEGGVQHKKKHN